MLTSSLQVAGLDPQNEDGSLLAVVSCWPRPLGADVLAATTDDRDAPQYYAPWCPFSQQHWETVSKVVSRFPRLRAVAVDVSLSPR